MQAWKKIMQYGKEYGWGYTVRKVWYRFLIKYYMGKKYYSDNISEKDRGEQQRFCEQKSTILVSIIVPVYNTPEKYFREMLESVMNQTYFCWELCLADASENCNIERIVTEYSNKDSRIKYQRLKENRGISENSNAAWKMAQGQCIALLDHDDILHPSALYWSVKEILEKDMDFVYTDELSFVRKTSVVQSIHLKSDFHWESFRNNNYICHFCMFRRELMEKAGGFRKEFDGAQDYDLFLRMAELTGKISHIPRVLYYWRLHSGSSAAGLQAKPYVTEAGKEALQQHLKRMGIAGKVVERMELGPYYHIEYQIRPDIRVLVLVEDSATERLIRETLKQCNYFVRIGVGEPIEKERELYDYIIVVKKGYLPEKSGQEWLEEVLQCLQIKENELVGVATCDTEGKYIQAGYCYDMTWGKKIRPLYEGVPIKDPAYMNRLLFRQNVGMLGGAVLGMPSGLFGAWREEVRGSIFEQKNWFLLSLMVRERGKECVLSPRIRWRQVNKMAQGIGVGELEERWMKQIKEDNCYHPDMRTFGKVYFLWKN